MSSATSKPWLFLTRRWGVGWSAVLLASSCLHQHFGSCTTYPPQPPSPRMLLVNCHQCCSRKRGCSHICTLSLATSRSQVIETNICVSSACVPVTSAPARGRFPRPYLPPGTVPCVRHTTESFIYSCNMFSEHVLYARHYAGHWSTTTAWASQCLPKTVCWQVRHVRRKLPHYQREMWEHRRCYERWG